MADVIDKIAVAEAGNNVKGAADVITITVAVVAAMAACKAADAGTISTTRRKAMIISAMSARHRLTLRMKPIISTPHRLRQKRKRL